MNSHTRRGLFMAALAAVAGFLGFQLGHQAANPVSPVSPEIAIREHPLIGIPSMKSDSYARAVRVAGGIPVILPNTDHSEKLIGEYLTVLDGLLMPGGADIPPSEYGAEPHETVVILDDDRYYFEKALIKAWVEKTNKPLLGICLGSQWINVIHGGSLIQDLPSALNVNHREVDHEIQLVPDSRLGKIFGETEFTVNSYHHQAVDNIGKGLRIVARCDDGVVEATETTDPKRFLIGVQWHPEKVIPDDLRQLKLLRAFVEAAKK